MMHHLTVLSCLMFCLAKTIYLFAKEIELNILFVQSKLKYSSTIVKWNINTKLLNSNLFCERGLVIVYILLLFYEEKYNIFQKIKHYYHCTKDTLQNVGCEIVNA